MLGKRLRRLVDVLERLLRQRGRRAGSGVLIGPVVSRKSGRTWRSAGASACADGISLRDAGPSICAKRLALVQRALRLLQRRRELLERRPDRGLLLRERAEHGVRGAHEPRELRVALAELGAELAEVGDHPAQVLTPLHERAVDAGDVADGRVEAPQPGRQLLRVTVEPLGAALEQELEEGLGVAVEAGQDLVRVDVRLRVGERDRSSPPEPPVPFWPGSISIVMSCRPVRGRSSSEASGWMSGAYLGSMFIVTTARPLSRFTPWTLPTLIPERSTVCPWPGRHRLRRAELGLELEVALAQDRDPGREVGLLPDQDHAGRDDRQHDEDADRHEVAAGALGSRASLDRLRVGRALARQAGR